MAEQINHTADFYLTPVFVFQFYRCFCSLLKCDRKSGLSSNKGSLRSTRMCCTVPRQDNNFTFVAASAGQPSSEHPEATVSLQNPEPTALNGPKAKQTVLLVAHYSAWEEANSLPFQTEKQVELKRSRTWGVPNEHKLVSLSGAQTACYVSLRKVILNLWGTEVLILCLESPNAENSMVNSFF